MSLQLSVLLSVLLSIAIVPALFGATYLALLALAARRVEAPSPDATLAVTVIVPAHDEADGIASTVQSLLAMDYPRDRFRVLVVADNCTDATADIARAAGAIVTERRDVDNRGKGHALVHAYALVLRERWADAVVVVDADTIVSANLLGAVGARLVAGAECAQVEYGVRNADDSWRTRLMALAFTLHHTLRSLGRERLRLSCGLHGNGMAFRTSLLARIPHRSTALVEDIEYGLTLGVCGVRALYIPEATVRAEMPVDEAASRTQRDRWERGRRLLVRTWTLPLLRSVAGVGGAIALDLVADLLVPPLVTLVAMQLLGGIVAVTLWWLGLIGVVLPALWMLSLGLLVVYIARGCSLSPAGWRVVRDLAWVPVYAVWKLSLRFRGGHDATWIRTARVVRSESERDSRRANVGEDPTGNAPERLP